MENTQKKLVELVENLSAIEVCLKNGELNYAELILFLQYDVPLEQSSERYALLKRVMHELRPRNFKRPDDREEKLIAILINLQDFIAENDRNGSQAKTVYKKTLDISEQICTQLRTQHLIKTANVLSQEKAAL